MATGENVLWVIRKYKPVGDATVHIGLWVFRTREAAQQFREAKQARTNKFMYTVPMRATWGPEQ